jgi:hypothetical protein
MKFVDAPRPVISARPALRIVASAPVDVPRQSTALRSVRSGGHERLLRTLDRLALFGMVVAVALMPVLAAGHAAKRPAAIKAPLASAASEHEDLGFFGALSAIGYAIWRPTPSLSRPAPNPSQQDRSAPAPRHFLTTN